MTQITTRIDWQAARERLQAITTDPALLEGFERVAQKGDIDDAFLEAALDANISLDYLIVGKGAPFSKGPKRDNAGLARLLDDYMHCSAEDQKLVRIGMKLLKSEPWAQEMGPERLHQWLKREHGAGARGHDK